MRSLRSILIVSLVIGVAAVALAGAQDALQSAYRAADKGHQKKALRLVTRAIVKGSKSGKLSLQELAQAYNFRGTLLMSKKPAKAIRDLNMAIKLDPKAGSAFCNRSVWYEAEGQKALALRDMKKCVKLLPKAKWARRRLDELQSKN